MAALLLANRTPRHGPILSSGYLGFYKLSAFERVAAHRQLVSLVTRPHLSNRPLCVRTGSVDSEQPVSLTGRWTLRYSSSSLSCPTTPTTITTASYLWIAGLLLCGFAGGQTADGRINLHQDHSVSCKSWFGWIRGAPENDDRRNNEESTETADAAQTRSATPTIIIDDSTATQRINANDTDTATTTSSIRSNGEGGKVQLQRKDNGYNSDRIEQSKQSQRLSKKFRRTAIFSGNANQPLAEDIADCLGTKLGRVRLSHFADGEVSLQLLDSLRGKDVYIIQGTSPPVNENLMELLLMVSTCRRSSAKMITAVIPYYGYARQDRKLSSRVPISAADVARMIEAMGVDRVISVDLHSGQIQGFFGPRVPFDNLEAQVIGLNYFAQKELDRPVVVSPDAGGVYRARKFQESLRAKGKADTGIAMLIKQRARANEIESMDVVGSVEGCDVIIVDDMIDTAGTLCEAAKKLRQHGAKRVFAFATHGLFSGPALKRIEESVLEEVVVSDTVQLSPEARQCNRITQLSIASLIADTIRCITLKESLQELFSTTA